MWNYGATWDTPEVGAGRLDRPLIHGALQLRQNTVATSPLSQPGGSLACG